MRALSNNEGPLRITYPDCTNDDITAEQRAIRAFLIKGAGRDLTDLFKELRDQTNSCYLISSGTVTNEAVGAYLLGLTQSGISALKLTVAEVVRTNKYFQPNKGDGRANMRRAAQNGRELILGAITKTMGDSTEFHALILEVSAEHCTVAQSAFANAYKAAEPKIHADHAKVWIVSMDSSGDDSIEEVDFLKFIDGAQDMPLRKPRKKETKRLAAEPPPTDIEVS